jgi:hypothetical protein
MPTVASVYEGIAKGPRERRDDISDALFMAREDYRRHIVSVSQVLRDAAGQLSRGGLTSMAVNLEYKEAADLLEYDGFVVEWDDNLAYISWEGEDGADEGSPSDVDEG